MLPFSSKKQANLIRQENNIPDEDWQRRRDHQLCTSMLMSRAASSLLMDGKCGLTRIRSVRAGRQAQVAKAQRQPEATAELELQVYDD